MRLKIAQVVSNWFEDKCTKYNYKFFAKIVIKILLLVLLFLNEVCLLENSLLSKRDKFETIFKRF